MNTPPLPPVSVIIPCRNEEPCIRRCLDSILAQDFPHERMEVLIVDGMSEDNTRHIIETEYLKYSFIKVIDNPDRTTPFALNRGIAAGRGEIVLIMGAHSRYEPDYISQCVRSLLESGADNVGGVCKVLPGASTLVAKAIAAALGSPFGVGNSHFRIGSKTARYVDTVFGGCYRRATFDKIGLFATDLIRGQDTELNARLINAGGKILLVPDIVSCYSARETLPKLWGMVWQYGHFKPLVIKKVGRLFTWRQVVPPLFVLALALSLGLALLSPPHAFVFWTLLAVYTAANIAFSIRTSLKTDFRCVWVLPLVFALIHIGWGSGFLKGLWDHMVLQKDSKRIADVTLTR